MPLRVKNVTWKDAKQTLSKLREEVYVYGWRIPAEREFDQHDDQAFHILMSDDKHEPIATARLTHEGELGRIAVKPKFRDKRVYIALSKALLKIARQQNLQEVVVLCDLSAVDEFKQQGFRSVGQAFMEAGIPRQKMACAVESFSLAKVDLMH
ncbi:GNAT family N-acetyltransferase [Aestuariibacter salexigens]|uniref:GNAT family N-acetyltransferase n=1 Tax=Aestuariibacter salexigens TaxID=226010 RepID=UPI00047A09A7|nr:GNAT family N-acetyltransferase [Aestuariibacter salexigens]